MSDKPTSGILDTQAQGLLKRLRDNQIARCDAIEEAARERASDVVRAAYAENRERLHRVAEELRRSRRHQALIASAREQSQRREQRQALAREMLSSGWTALEAVLQRYWADPERRAAWVQEVLERARQALPRALWSVGCPQDWAETERQALDEAIRTHCGESPTWHPDEGVSAGIWIGGEGLFLDASVGEPEHGLLAGRRELEARLLHHMERLMRESET